MSKRILILGGGESGTGAACLAKKQGYEVVLSDRGTMKPQHRELLHKWEVPFEEGAHGKLSELPADEVIKSPGIPDSAPRVAQALASGVPVISEIEFAARHTSAHLTAITGSNGKTTTTLLTWHVLNKAGLHVGLAGNVGKSFAYQVATENFSHYVLEVSSFQLDNVFDTRFHTAVLLNITPDHLDRYNYQMERYAASKFRVARNQQPGDAFIFCADDEGIATYWPAEGLRATHYPFSIRQTQGMSAWIGDPDQLNIQVNSKPFTMSIHDLALQGKHNLYNTMAAGIASRILEIRKDIVRDSLADFQNVEHRLEHVAQIHGIQFINDSKATNVNSTWYALESQQAPIIWIVGGVDKGNDYSSLLPLVQEKVKAIVCMGKDNAKILEFFSPLGLPMVEAHSAEEAVNASYRLGTKGDTVLLSPACASFDLFENYEDRGRQFKTAVRAL